MLPQKNGICIKMFKKLLHLQCKNLANRLVKRERKFKEIFVVEFSFQGTLRGIKIMISSNYSTFRKDLSANPVWRGKSYSFKV